MNILIFPNDYETEEVVTNLEYNGTMSECMIIKIIMHLQKNFLLVDYYNPTFNKQHI